MEHLSRRSFVTSAALAAAGTACAATAHAATPLADTGSWDDEADIVICGAGCAGLAAACTAAFESLGTTLNLEAAPAEHCGGNSAATMGVLFCPNDVEGAKLYQSNLNGFYHNFMDEEIFDVWAHDIVTNKDWMEENFDCEYEPCKIGTAGIEGEFPTIPGAEFCPTYQRTEGTTWGAIKAKFDELGLPIYYDARAMRLITNDAGQVIGVECEDGRRFKANKGVLLATGGFENNDEMMRAYMPAGYPHTRGMGGYYNLGDGIKMAMTMGADLTHMSNVSGAALGLRIVPDSSDFDARTWTSWKSKGYIYVDQHGRRFMDENIKRIHGKSYIGGTFIESPMPEGAWAIFNQAEFDGPDGNGGCIYLQECFSVVKGVDCFHSNEQALEAGSIIKCETVAELAQATGLPEAELQKSLDRYNGFVAQNYDEDFGRGRETNLYCEPKDGLGNPDEYTGRAAFDLVAIEAPYYCVRVYGTILNTQGGPRRSVDCEIIDVFGEPIPRLYSAGEMGCEYDYIYNAGGNISEAISSGRRAARIISALDPVK